MINYEVAPKKPWNFSLKFATARVKRDTDGTQPRDWHGRFGEGSGSTEGSGNLPFNPHGDQYFHALSQAARDKIAVAQEKFGVRSEAVQKEIVSRIQAGALGMDEKQLIAAGAQWYPMAHEVAQKTSDSTQDMPHPISMEQVAGAMASMSPQTGWEIDCEISARLSQWVASGAGDGLARSETLQSSSKDDMVQAFKADVIENGWMGYKKEGGFVDPKSAGTYDANIGRALNILTGFANDGSPATVESELGSPKMRSFANDIMLPGVTDDVTADIMMQKSLTFASDTGYLPKTSKDATAAGLDPKITVDNFFTANKGVSAGAGYVTIASATRVAGEALGAPPDTVQAAYWIAVQDITPPNWEASAPVTPTYMPLTTELLGHPFIGANTSDGRGNVYPRYTGQSVAAATKAAPLPEHAPKGFPLHVDLEYQPLTPLELMSTEEAAALLERETVNTERWIADHVKHS